MIKKKKAMENTLVLFTIFTLCLALIIGCNSASNLNSPQQTPSASSSPTTTVAVATPQIEGKITKQELGSEWAFTVDEGVLGCEGEKGFGTVTFTTGDKTYAINGIKKGGSKYELIDPIWAEDPSIKGAKKDIGAILRRGLMLCK